ncbi:MAG: ferritin-like domain-containing protein [Candidatus Zipacnadales bacterium]
MGVQFNADEVFEMAEQIERNGAKFYRKAAISAEGETKAILLRFAAMEDQHEKTFQAMRAELPEEARKPFVFDPDNEVGAYARAMADGYVFDVREDPSETISAATPLEQIFKIALQREKESVVFYAGIKEMVPGQPGKSQLDKIIKEELGHIGVLSRELALRR